MEPFSWLFVLAEKEEQDFIVRVFQSEKEEEISRLNEQDETETEKRKKRKGRYTFFLRRIEEEKKNRKKKKKKSNEKEFMKSLEGYMIWFFIVCYLL